MGTKPYVVRYRVDGDTLIHNSGKGRSTIIENNADHIISYVAIVSDVHRFPNNSPPVVVAEPSVSYYIIEEASGRFTELSDIATEVMVNRYGTLPPPDVETGHCKPE